jgi:N-acetyl-anhydromuramyl-L-alanine amidase AmpD
VSDDPPKPVITRTTKLSEVQRLLKERKPIDGRARMVRSIQQSMRVEGYDVAAEVVAKAVEDVFGAPRKG